VFDGSKSLIKKEEDKTAVFHLYEQPKKDDTESQFTNRDTFKSKNFISEEIKAEKSIAGNFLTINSKC